jgi:hypothetical protein
VYGALAVALLDPNDLPAGEMSIIKAEKSHPFACFPFARLPVCLFACLPVCLFACLPVCLFGNSTVHPSMLG